MARYNVSIGEIADKEVIVEVGFGDEPAMNDELTKEAQLKAKSIADEVMGKLVKIKGPASLPISFVLAHEFNHIATAVAVFDPKLGRYVVAVSHHPDYKIGDLVE